MPFPYKEGILFCEFLGLVAGGFTGGGEGDVSNVDVGARMVVLGTLLLHSLQYAGCQSELVGAKGQGG